mmetsp:Transcript_22938/g.58801  ORF Transcript_22938/g.58801 Transcript_22938/m.58801 type:complete len:180 (+) Transcript_22938:2-541(+)
MEGAEGAVCHPLFADDRELEKNLKSQIATLESQLSQARSLDRSDMFTGERSHLLSACGALRHEAADVEDDPTEVDSLREKCDSLEKANGALSIQCEELNRAYKQALEDKANLLKRHAQDRERLRLAHEASMESYRSQNSSLAEENHELRSLVASRDSELQALRARDKVAFIPHRSWGQL